MNEKFIWNMQSPKWKLLIRKINKLLERKKIKIIIKNLTLHFYSRQTEKYVGLRI